MSETLKRVLKAAKDMLTGCHIQSQCCNSIILEQSHNNETSNKATVIPTSNDNNEKSLTVELDPDEEKVN